MSGWDVAAVAGGLAVALSVTVVLARLVVAVGSLDRTTGELVRAIEDVRRDARRPETVLLGDGVTGAPGSPELVGNGRSDGSRRSGGRRSGGRRSGGRGGRPNGAGEPHAATPMLARVDVRPRLFDLGLVSPVIKARALGRGTSQAARQFRQRRER
jgi:hypothetical protein